jgi:enolase
MHPRQILDSRGNPTIEIDLIDNNKGGALVGRGAAPSGASTGSNEAVERRDKNRDNYMGKGVFECLETVRDLSLKMKLTPLKVCDLIGCDRYLIETDGTQLKKRLGGNVTTAVSFLIAESGSGILGIPLYKHLRNVYGYNNTTKKWRMPIPMVNILNGGKHAGGKLKIQEFMIMPSEKVVGESFSRSVEYVFRVYHNLKSILCEKYGPGATNLGDEGGFAPSCIDTPDEALNLIESAVHKSGLIVGKDIFLALDCAASEFYDAESGSGGYYAVETDREPLTSKELIEYYSQLIEKHPALISIEDPFDEHDYSSWIEFTRKFKHRLMVVGDDLFTTNPETIRTGIVDGGSSNEMWANALLLKVNQIGTITEAVRGAEIMQSHNLDVIVSHRSGETNNSLISDLAVGINAKYIKLGAPARGERVAKYNRLIQIEETI